MGYAMGGAEQLQSGSWVSFKYHAISHCNVKATVVIFSNVEPYISSLSIDKWKVMRLNGKFDYMILKRAELLELKERQQEFYEERYGVKGKNFKKGK
jgi:hypothetical protein